MIEAMLLPTAFLYLLPVCLLTAPLDDLGGGASGSHGRIPRFVLESWLPGVPSAFRFLDLPPASIGGVGLLSDQGASIALPFGTLTVDITRPAFVVFPVTPSAALPVLPAGLNGLSLWLQGAYIDQGKILLTDGTKADVFKPSVMVGNQRQSSNSISVIDAIQRNVVQRLTNSENGYITFSADRKWAYVCEPGLQRNRVVFYDLTKTPITSPGSATVNGGIRYGCAVTRDGKRVYAPVHDGISIIDADPQSSTFMTELQKFPSKITGNPGSIFTGPLDVAVTPNGRKLYIAYGENLTYPAKSSVGVVDLTQSSYPETLIPITTGGTFAVPTLPEFATHPRIKVSNDGLHVYVCEWGLDPAQLGQFVKGFQNGALVKVIFTPLDREVAAIATKGFQQSELCVDRMGRNLWVAQIGPAGIGQVLRVDVDTRSATRFQKTTAIQVHPVAYATGAGPLGIDVTPDGSLVFVSVAEDASHTQPLVFTVDARTDQITGQPIPVESLCATLSIQQR
jgi:DNA-binding beta-propeller fold protein YncE